MKTLADVTAFVLVGGLGTRLRAVIGEETPKPLAKIGDQPFLRLLLEWLGQQGIRNVVLGTGHLAAEFETLLTSYCPVGMTVA
jgi:NDP-sugar pyrophosphorylase family protein